MNIYERIKLLATKNDTTIKSIEKELGIGNGTIKGWITSSPRCDKIIAIANKFNVSIEWLLLGKEFKSTINLNNDELTLINNFRLAKDDAREYACLILKAGKKEEEKSSEFKTG